MFQLHAICTNPDMGVYFRRGFFLPAFAGSSDLEITWYFLSSLFIPFFFFVVFFQFRPLPRSVVSALELGWCSGCNDVVVQQPCT